jgi:heme oxygenase
MTFQEQIKNETKVNHDAAEQHEFNTQLMSGILPDQKYYLYLKNIVPIYDYIEKRLGFTGELIRSTLVYNDISAYAKFGCTNGPSNYFVYDWMATLAQKSDDMLLSEVYVEWLKDVYGGQMISKQVRYGSHLKFNNVKDTIGKIRMRLSLPFDKEKDFIFEINRTYVNHYNLYDSIMYGEK